MKIRIIDSHRDFSQSRRARIRDFFMESKGLDADAAEKQVAFCEWFETEYAVKWFEVFATHKGQIVGYLRCMRSEKKATDWLIGDVYVKEAYRGRNVATKMYELLFDTLADFSATEQIYTYVDRSNKASIELHRKLGFQRSNRKEPFKIFVQLENDLVFCKKLVQWLPISDFDAGMVLLEPIWDAYEEKTGRLKAGRKQRLSKLLRQTLQEDENSFLTAWCGNRLIGFYAISNQEEIEFTTEKV